MKRCPYCRLTLADDTAACPCGASLAAVHPFLAALLLGSAIGPVALSYFIVGIPPRYGFAAPYLFFGLGCVLTALGALVLPLHRRGLTTTSAACALGMPVAAVLALGQWPGGDDGPGMAWRYFVQYPSVLIGALGAVILVVRTVRALRTFLRPHSVPSE
jgi:hypothetical protein